MTNREILETAMRQSAVDQNCDPGDYLLSEHKISESRPNPLARKYLQLPFDCDLVSYGHNIAASVSAPCRKLTEEYLNTYPAVHCFETPHLHVLNSALAPLGLGICFMAEYFLPDLNALSAPGCAYRIRILEPSEFSNLYQPQWSNALCEKRKELDAVAAGAYDENGRLAGLAGASADCETMWQIGVDVLPEYRGRGIAAALTGCLAFEILQRGKVPFYCAAWSNLASVRTALRCGFRPGWVEVTAKPLEYIRQMNTPRSPQ